MRALSLSLLSLTLLTGAASAHEHCAAPTATVQLSPDQMRDLEGSYRLSDGRVLQISASATRLYADVKKHRRLALLATGPNTLVSQDGAVSITYDPANPVETLKLKD
jgi:hypothetical protein